MKTWHILFAGLFAVALWVASAVVVVYVLPLCGWEQRAQFGDMFGAVSALFSGLAFAGIILTILLQRDELRLQREELVLTRNELKGQKEQLQLQNETLKKQQFEATFFQMLRVFREQADNCDEAARRASFAGGFEGMANRIGTRCAERRRTAPSESVTEAISSAYDSVYGNMENCLGPYFRILFSIIELVDQSAIEDKKRYSNIVRALLSQSELVVLCFDGLSRYGREKLKPLIEKYALLKHLDRTESFELPTIADGYALSAFGK
jgi:hypothetical protein